MNPLPRKTVNLLAGAWLLAGAPSTAAAASAPLPSLEQIMADPDWIGAPVKSAYWAVDGRSLYYSQKHGGSTHVDLHRLDLAGGKDTVLDGRDIAGADGPAVFDRSGRRAAFVRNGDMFVKDPVTGRLQQITRTPQNESDPQFSADGRLLSFRAGPDWLIRDLATGLTSPAATLLLQKDPQAPPAADDLSDLQLRTFSTLRRNREEAQTERLHAERSRREDPTRAPRPFYLGDEVTVLESSLSPDGRWLAVVTAPKALKEAPREAKLTRYVTESGYEEFEKERPRVGRSPPAGQALLLLNLVEQTTHPVAFDTLPGIHDDPLLSIRLENGLPAAADAAKPRGVLIASQDEDDGLQGLRWSGDGRRLALELRAIDHKDRWIASVDFTQFTLHGEHRYQDPAWTSWAFNDFGWLNDDRTLWYESEESGYGHLYTKTPDGPPKALTSGRFEVYAPALSDDGRWFYLISNAGAPEAYDVYRVPSTGGTLQRVSRLDGVESFSLDHAGRRLAIRHSSSYVPTQLALQTADGSGPARELTDTRTAPYRSIAWIPPEFITVPSSHGAGSIHAKVYRAAAAGPGVHPGVMFVHGAGYTQDVHRRFPYYFREQMFHNLLAQKGYVVIDLDYRASQGYGRDWRTAIYRQMGHPELEDLLDGKQWLVQNAGVDPKRVGIYGGSYGGFMTLMALFRAPGEFAAGAALRPVTDWTQYDEEYTSAILNEPQVDPIAYARSSPLEFAAGLQDALLICHGVIDDNVLFEDSMRLYQRLIELHKDDFTIAPYPLDRHAFTNADSWLDEYKRIERLFDRHLGR